MSTLRPQALILDDSPVLARHLQQLLGRLGVGADVQAEDADIIFVEVLQACGNGFQLLRELARTRACPLVLLTGTGRASDRHWGLQGGAAAVLRRPVDEAALRACLQELGILPGASAALCHDAVG